MKDGLRIYNSDTHVLPAAEVLERYVDPGFRPRLAELAPYRAPIRQSAEHSGGGITAIASRRNTIAGCSARRRRARTIAAARPTGAAANCRGPACRTTRRPTASRDMDDEGTDVHFLIPSAWVGLSGSTTRRSKSA